MATTKEEERTRLINVGNFALNLYEKHKASFAEPSDGVPVSSESRVRIFQHDVQKLLTVGGVLGKHGKKFLVAGENIMVHDLQLEEDEKGMVTAIVPGLVALGRTRQEMRKMGLVDVDPAFEANLTQAADAIDAKWLPIAGPEKTRMIRELQDWTKDELMGVVAPKKDGVVVCKCSFCDTKAGKDIMLMVCGRCKAVRYCDKNCQKLHWKKGHKKECVEKAAKEELAGGEGA